MPSAAPRCSASATVSRSCARPGCCPAHYCRTARSRSPARTCICASRTIRRCSHQGTRPVRRSGCRSRITMELHRRPGHARPAGGRWPRRVPLLQRLGRAVGGRQFQRLGPRDRRRVQRDPHRAGSDAAPGERDRPAVGRHRRVRLFRRAGGRVGMTAISTFCAAPMRSILRRDNARHLEKRVAEHQSGIFGGYTAIRRPVALVFHQQFERLDDAAAAERQVKGWRRDKKKRSFGVISARCRFWRGAAQRRCVLRDGALRTPPRMTVRPLCQPVKTVMLRSARRARLEARSRNYRQQCHPRTGGRARVERRRVRAYLRDPRADAELDRARHLLRHVERALLVQIVEGVAAQASQRPGRA